MPPCRHIEVRDAPISRNAPGPPPDAEPRKQISWRAHHGDGRDRDEAGRHGAPARSARLRPGATRSTMGRRGAVSRSLAHRPALRRTSADVVSFGKLLSIKLPSHDPAGGSRRLRCILQAENCRPGPGRRLRYFRNISGSC
jgi:hypothetical protein